MHHFKPIIGTVRGNSIQFELPLNMPEGVRVEITVRPSPLSKDERLEKLSGLFGLCVDDGADLDEFMLWNREQRKRNRSEFGT